MLLAELFDFELKGRKTAWQFLGKLQKATVHTLEFDTDVEIIVGFMGPTETGHAEYCHCTVTTGRVKAVILVLY